MWLPLWLWDLRVAGLLPSTEPHTALGFVQAGNGGGESLHPGVSSATGDDATVDWVLVELRASGSPGTNVATRSALLQRDGDVVAEVGVTPIALLATPGNYHVAVRHRNHLGCMTATTRALNDAPTLVDLTLASTSTYGTNARFQSGSKQLLWTGNVLRDAILKYTGASNDRDPMLTLVGGTVPTNTVPGYLNADNTLDGIVKYTGAANDRDILLQNIGGGVPTGTRSEQLP